MPESNKWIINEITQDEKPWIRLVGEDGNAYSIIGRVRAAWRKLRRADIVEEYTKRVTGGDYANLLAVTMDYINEGEKEEEE